MAPHSTRIHLTPYGSILAPTPASRAGHPIVNEWRWPGGSARLRPSPESLWSIYAWLKATTRTCRPHLVTGEVTRSGCAPDLDVVARDRLANPTKGLVAAGATRPHGRRLAPALHRSSGVGALLHGQRLGATLMIRNPAPNVHRVHEIVDVNTFATNENT